MPQARTPFIFKPFSFIVFFSLLRALGNNLVMPAPPPFITNNVMALDEGNPPTPEITPISMLPFTEHEGMTLVTTTYQDGIKKTIIPQRFATLFQKILATKQFTQLSFALNDILLPQKERLAFNVITTHLEDTSRPEQDPYFLLIYCHFIESVHPSTGTTIHLKELLTQEMYRQYPDLDKARLDYHVGSKNFSVARQYLHAGLPQDYLNTFNRLALQISTKENLFSLSTTELLMHAQIPPLPLPFHHPIIRSGLSNDGVELVLHAINRLFSTAEEMERFDEEANALFDYKKATKDLTSRDIASLQLAQENPNHNPILKIEFGPITQKLIEHYHLRSNNKIALRQTLAAYAFESGETKLVFYDGLLKTLTQFKVELDTYDAALLHVRFILINKDQILPESLSKEMAIYKERLLKRPSTDGHLFLIYGEPEEAIIRDLYPPDVAEKIIEKEKSLALQLEVPLQKTRNDKRLIDYWPLFPLIAIMGSTLYHIHAREKKRQKEKAWQDKFMARHKTNPERAAPVIKRATLSDIILEAASLVLDRATLACPTMDEASKTNPLPIKKHVSSRTETGESKRIEIHFPDKLNEKLITFYNNQRKAFDEACTLEGVRQAEALKAIGTRCNYLIARHLAGELSALSVRNNELEAPPEDKLAALKERINRLLANEKFPTHPQSTWVKLPTTTLDDLQDEVKDECSDPQIKTQFNTLLKLNDSLINLKHQLDSHKLNYHHLIQAYDNTAHPNEDALVEFSEKMAGAQIASEPLMENIANESKQFDALVFSIRKRYRLLEATKTQPQESKEERDARIQHVRAEIKRKKDEVKAKAQALIDEKERQAEAVRKMEAERQQENEDRKRNSVLTRWQKPDDPKTMMALLYANTASFILNDIIHANDKDQAYLRDACILSCTQLYEALRDLSETVFGELLPKTKRLAHSRNVFVHQAIFFELPPETWKNIARDTYRHFFDFVNIYNQVHLRPGERVKVKAMPALDIFTQANEPSDLDKKAQFKAVCQRYLDFEKILKAICTNEKMPYQDREINLLVIAMRSLVMQIDDLGNEIGFSGKHEHLRFLAKVRNKEAHNGKRTSVQTLISLHTHVEALMNTVKLTKDNAKPSEVGLYSRKKKHPSPPKETPLRPSNVG